MLATFTTVAAAPAPRVDASLESLFRESWTTRDGLPHNSINAIVQTPEGYMWMATWEGLVRFNGREFTTFDRGDIPELLDGALRTLHVDAEGRLIMGGARGTLVRQAASGGWDALPPAPVMVTDLIEDARGDLYAGTETDLIHRIDSAGRVDALLPLGEEKLGSSFDLLLDRREGLWAATQGGLFSVSPAGLSVAKTEGLPTGAVTALANAPDGRLLAGTPRGLYVASLDGATLDFQAVSPETSGIGVSTLLPDPQGGLWIGTLNEGLMHWDGKTLRRLGVGPDKPSTRIMSLYIDREDHLWVGTNSGLFRLTDAAFTSITRQQGLRDDYVRAVLAEPDGSVVLGTAQGLARVDPSGRVSSLGAGTALERASVLSLASEGPNRLWVGTYTSGLLLWDGEALKPGLNSGSGLGSNEVRTIAPDGRGGLWIGTTLGLAHWKDGELRHWTEADGLPSNFVIALSVDPSGRLWVGTGVGAAVIENGQLRRLDFGEALNAEYALAFLQDPAHDSVWVASDRGLIRLDPSGQPTGSIGLANDLPYEKVFGLLLDGNGQVWMSGNRGVVRMDLAKAHAVADGRVATIDAEHFTEADGMTSAQGNGGSQPVTALDTLGRPWFATAIGAVRADPDDLQRSSQRAPPVVVESLKADGRDIKLQDGGALSLPADTRRIELHYAGLGFLLPERLRYRYRLIGFDEAWVERVGRTVAEFTGLPPGRYRFEVETAHPRGEWGDRRAVVEFLVPMQWWQQRWLQGLGLALSLLAAWLAYRLRLRRLMASEQRLAALVSERTTQLEQQKSLLRDQALEFEREARQDALTGIANRRDFDERLDTELSRAARSKEPFSVILADIDHFKAVNDRWTHAVGDVVLKRIAQVLNTQCRPFDTVARWGGEEFALLLPGTPHEEALRVAERLREAVQAIEFKDIDAALRVTTSFGVATAVDADDHSRLMSLADTALYRAKARGRNRVEG